MARGSHSAHLQRGGAAHEAEDDAGLCEVGSGQREAVGMPDLHFVQFCRIAAMPGVRDTDAAGSYCDK